MKIVGVFLQSVLLGVSFSSAQVLFFSDETQVFYNGGQVEGVDFSGSEVTVSRDVISAVNYKNVPLSFQQPYPISADTVVAFEIKEQGTANFVQCFGVENRDVTIAWSSPFPANLGIGNNSLVNNNNRLLEPSPNGTTSWVFANNYEQYGVLEQQLSNDWIRYSVNISQLLANRSPSFSNPDTISGFFLGFVGGDETTKITYRNFRIYEENSENVDYGTLAAHEDLWVDGNIYLAGDLLSQNGSDLFNQLLAEASLEPQGDIAMGIFGNSQSNQ